MSDDLTFCLTSYREMLTSALDSGYEFTAFDDIARPRPDNKICLLRHDVDTNLAAAYEMAVIEAELGINATYFAMLRSAVYNLLSRSNDSLVRQIIAMGHWLGLHHDANYTPDRISLADRIRDEAEILARNFNTVVGSVSFHQPSPELVRDKPRIQGLINTYSDIDLPGFHYVSDTNMQWRQDDPLTLFRQGVSKIHLLIHPMWWVGSPDDPPETKWDNALRANWIRTQDQILETERAYGPPRKFLLKR